MAEQKTEGARQDTLGSVAVPVQPDAYVSHAEADRRWVEEVLTTRLERAGRRLLLESDLPLGGLELEERSRAVADSRKTLLILSPAYLESRWGAYEQAIAHQLGPTAQKRRLIPVLRQPCRIPLRVRPLVAVDLSKDDPRQWQRLLDALDPKRSANSNWAERSRLGLTALTTGTRDPSWHRAGGLALAGAYGLSVALLLLVWVWIWSETGFAHVIEPLLLLMHGPLLLAFREDLDLLPRLSQLLGAWRPTRPLLAGVALAVSLAWAQLGWPALQNLACGPSGCGEKGQIRMALTNFEGEIGGQSEGRVTGESLRIALVQKLMALPSVKVVNQESPSLTEHARRTLRLDYTLEGELSQEPAPTLRAVLYDRELTATPPALTAQARLGATVGEALNTLQDQIIHALSERFGLHLTEADVERIASLPTNQPEALDLNAAGVSRLGRGDLGAAEERFRQAIEIDSGYAIAYSNLAETLWLQGRHAEALSNRKRAVELFPEYAPLHYGLGHLLASMGRELAAVAPLEEAIRRDPAHLPAYNELGRVWLELGEPRQAAEVLEAGWSLETTEAALAKNLGRARLELRQLEAAREKLEKALGLYAEDDWLGRAEALALLFAVDLGRGDLDAICHSAERLRLHDPQGIAPSSSEAFQSALALPCPRASI